MMNQSSPRIITRIILGQPLTSVRLMAALFVFCSSVLKLLTDYYLPEFIDISSVRWLLNGLIALFFCLLFFYHSSRAIAYGTLVLYTSALLYSIYLLIINLFHPAAAIFFLLILAGGTITINNILLYLILSLHIFLACLVTYHTHALTHEQIITFYSILLSLIVFGVIIHIRIKLRSSVAFHHSFLEKINVLSIIVNKVGEVIFISPSINTLLGYDQKEVLGNGWWQIEELSKNWIPKEHILMYPNIIQKENKTFERLIHSKNGETKWLNWENAILPNGNYMGIALDISKYKQVVPSEEAIEE